MSNLTILVGLPRSGKSTWAKNWEEGKIEGFTKTDYKNRVVVSQDDLHLALTGKVYHKLSEPFVKANAELIARIYLARGYKVVLDDTHTSLENLERSLFIDPDAEIKIILPHEDIDESVKICKERAILTNQKYLLPVIDRHAENLIYWYNDQEKMLPILRKSARNAQT